jgi:3-hydroxymyristoyl/3-hydroxydecanoyl-(acyl carrier protein) dehydratase
MKVNETISVAVNIPLNHPAYKDHFPDFTIVPGVIILEQVLSACAKEGLPVAHIKSCKFLRMVPPGLRAELIIKRRSNSEATLLLTADDMVYLRATLT